MFAKEISAGIEWAEQYSGERWAWLIDLESFDITWPTQCMVGQLHGDYYDAVDTGLLTRAQMRDYGFTLPGYTDGDEWENLNAEWIAAIQQARDESKQSESV
jgi:hypothetical protein